MGDRGKRGEYEIQALVRVRRAEPLQRLIGGNSGYALFHKTQVGIY